MRARNPDFSIISIGLQRFIVVGVPFETIEFENNVDVTRRYDAFDGMVGLEFLEMKDAFDQVSIGLLWVVGLKNHGKSRSRT